ncbi:DUF805 domain-containing protein [Hyphomonas sp.]|jgi:uncharacterized membrane protein YhaH (DUF805 family)|uniref:DUF805 domain-containing protein n=1 Tax=Hyphomonas sp. TaxID=87 RepID=UPI00356A3477
MRGEVLKPDNLDGAGLILGEDGQRYQFTQLQVRNGAVLHAGQTVDFISMGEEARDIYALGAAAAQPATTPPAYAGAPPALPTAAYATAVPLKSDGLWAYFTRTLTKNFVQFHGRARRAEYWGYVLFATIFYVAALLVDVMLSLAFYGTDEYGDPIILPILFIVFVLYNILPSLSITIRRLHDRDLSGWMYLISLIPYIGGLILLVLMILDSKPAANKHGPSPKYMGATTADTFA